MTFHAARPGVTPSAAPPLLGKWEAIIASHPKLKGPNATPTAAVPHAPRIYTGTVDQDAADAILARAHDVLVWEEQVTAREALQPYVHNEPASRRAYNLAGYVRNIVRGIRAARHTTPRHRKTLSSSRVDGRLTVHLKN